MDIAERLKDERKRLGLNQTEFGKLAGVGKTTQINYESGERSPDANYLAAIVEAGADVQYIVTGVRSDVALTPDERELVALFRAAPLAVKASAIGALKGGTAPQAAPRYTVQQTFKGDVRQQASGDIVNKGRKKT